MFGGIDIYQDAKGHFPMGAARFIHRPGDGARCGEFVGTIYCDRGHIRQPFDDTLVHVLDGEPRPFEVSALLERAAKPPEGLRIGIPAWAGHPPPVNETELWVGRILSEAYSTWGPFRHWKLEAVGHSDGECESGIRGRLGLPADEPLPRYVVILPPYAIEQNRRVEPKVPSLERWQP